MMGKELLTDEDVGVLVNALAFGQKDEGATEDDFERFVHWVEQVLVDAAVVELILAGKMKARVPRAGDPDLTNYLFAATTKKEEAALIAVRKGEAPRK